MPADLPTGNLYYLYGFIAVAVFTLLVACINYMNLATARAAKRAKEVGMRKMLGSSRGALIVQFLAESLLLAVVSVVLGVLLVKLVVAFTPISELLGMPISTELHADARGARLGRRARVDRGVGRGPVSGLLSLLDRARVDARRRRARQHAQLEPARGRSCSCSS